MADIMKSFNGYEVCDAVSRGMSPVIATSEDGVGYTATVNGITELTTGLTFVMIPNIKNTTMSPTLDVNGLGAKYIRIRSSTSSITTIPVNESGDWFNEGSPIRVVYDANIIGGIWIIDCTIPDANHLYGEVPIESGGTGADTVGGARNNLGLDGVNEDGTGALSIENGGTGCTSIEDLKILINSNVENGVVPISSGGTGADNATEALNNLGALSKSGGSVTESFEIKCGNNESNASISLDNGGTEIQEGLTASMSLTNSSTSGGYSEEAYIKLSSIPTDTEVRTNAYIRADNVTIGGDVSIPGSARIKGGAYIIGNTTIEGNTNIDGDISANNFNPVSRLFYKGNLEYEQTKHLTVSNKIFDYSLFAVKLVGVATPFIGFRYQDTMSPDDSTTSRNIRFNGVACSTGSNPVMNMYYGIIGINRNTMGNGEPRITNNGVYRKSGTNSTELLKSGNGNIEAIWGLC